MMNFLRKHMRKIFLITISAFVAGIFFSGFGTAFFSRDHQSAATVNSTEIPLSLFNSMYLSSTEMMRNMSKEELTDEMLTQIKIKTLQALIQEELFYQQSKKYGIQVSDLELTRDIQNSAMFKNNNMFDPRMYYAFLRGLKLTPKEYENLRRKQISGEKLKILLASSIKLMNAEYEAAAKADPNMTRDLALQMKINTLLNEWYINLAKSSKITSNDLIFTR
ncbi:MAG: SurA N-terminal domain-containing protein [Endomicrobia bacterium]|nr:SurA N-terminal domain-containing protein [Endomicrobiia bacterium]MCL2506733.1 SurA N-terminal domain-containing protein [Endomicrobiia bacterium]